MSYRRQRRFQRRDENGLTTVDRSRVRELPIKIEDLLA